MSRPTTGMMVDKHPRARPLRIPVAADCFWVSAITQHLSPPIVFIRTALNGRTCMMKGAPRFELYVFLCSPPFEDEISMESRETVTKNPAL